MASAPFSGVSTTETLRCSGAVPPRPVLVSAAHVLRGTVNVQLPGPATPIEFGPSKSGLRQLVIRR